MSAPIAAERLRALSTGRVAATHLAECLAVDFAALLQVVAPALAPEALQRMQDASGKGITLRMALAAQLLREAGQGDPVQWQDHASDTVRGWACYLIGSDAGTPLAGKLQAIRTLADDPHFGVREWAWLALRADIVAAPLHRCRRLGTCNRGRRKYRRTCAVSPARRCVPGASGLRISRCSSSSPNTQCRCWTRWPTTPSAMCRTPSAIGSTMPARRSRNGCVGCAHVGNASTTAMPTPTSANAPCDHCGNGGRWPAIP